MKLLSFILDLVYPPKCVLCATPLEKEETDLCRSCRINAPDCSYTGKKIPHIARWSAVWYYEDTVRESLLRYKFNGVRSYSAAYGRMLAMKLQPETEEDDFILTWIPISRRRKRKRGYDQVELLAAAAGNELGITPVQTLVKVRDNPPQSTIDSVAARRANVLGAYQPVNPEQFAGKRILLLDDIITTGATASEAARVLMSAGAKEVICAAVAAASHQQKNL